MRLFDFTKRRAGLDVRDGRIRFIELARSGGFERVSAYGYADAGVPGTVEFTDAARSIRKLIRAGRVTVATTNDESAAVTQALSAAGFSVGLVVTPAEAVARAVIPTDAMTSFLAINVEPRTVDIVVFDPTTGFSYGESEAANYAIVSEMNRIFVNWYDVHQEKIDHVVLSGERAADQQFIDYVSHETRLSIYRANVFANLDLDPGTVPMIAKKDSYAYAVAIGAALS